MRARDLVIMAGAAMVGSLLTYIVMAPGGDSGAESGAAAIASTDHAVASHLEELKECRADLETYENAILDAKALVSREKKPVTGRADKTDEEMQALRLQIEAGEDPEQLSDKDIDAEINRRMQERREKARIFTDFVAEEVDSDFRALNSRVENRFYQEEWDREWAVETEAGIQSLFERQEGLSHITPLQVTCRSKNCQVVLPLDNPDQVESLSQQLRESTEGGDFGMKDPSVSFFPDVDTGRVTLYFSEDGNMELFQ